MMSPLRQHRPGRQVEKVPTTPEWVRYDAALLKQVAERRQLSVFERRWLRYLRLAADDTASLYDQAAALARACKAMRAEAEGN